LCNNKNLGSTHIGQIKDGRLSTQLKANSKLASYLKGVLLIN